MKIVSWNCNGKFRSKYEKIMELEADIYIIQECEPPENFTKKTISEFGKYIWEKGPNKKGVLIFSKNSIKIEKLKWQNFGMRVFIPIRVDNKYTVVAVWTTKPAYIEEFYVWQLVNSKRINRNVVFIGDFNSNVNWDKGHGGRGHSDTIKCLEQEGLVSIYHWSKNEKQGEESIATFYMYKNLERPFHIDHCFADPEKIKSYEINDDASHSWLEYSDHIPLVLELKD